MKPASQIRPQRRRADSHLELVLDKTPDTRGHLLIVDDSITTIEFIKRVLAGKAYRISSASNGEEAIRLASEDKPDLMLLDIMMPDMDGYEVCLRLQQGTELDVPVIFMSSLADSFDKVRAFELGAVDYVTKPLSPEELCARVANHMMTSRLHQQLADEVDRQTAELRKSERRYRLLFESSNDAILVNGVAGDGKLLGFTDVNAVACRWLGYSRRELLEKTFRDIMPPGSEGQLLALFRRVVERENDVFEYNIRTKSSGIIPVEISSRLFEREGKHQIISILRDISERKRAEETLKRSAERLRKAQKMEALGTLAGGIAHDFNNILCGIVGYADLIMYALREVPEEHGRAMLLAHADQIMKASGRARSLVKQILAYSRQSDSEKRPMELQSVVEEALKLLRASIPANIEIFTDIKPDTSPILADADQIHQVVMNLCTNAYQAMLDTGGKLMVCVHEQVASQQPDMAAGTYAVLIVRDTGCGIPRGTLDRIFDPYFTTKPKDQGTGLGLSVVHGIVKSNNGYITVDSKEGAGSMFCVYLPAIARSQPSRLTGSLAAAPGGSEHIMLIDDEEMILLSLKSILETLGYHVDTYSSPVEALSAFSADPYGYDGVITDMMMPVMDGLALVQHIFDIRRLPIVLTTGYSDPISKERARAVGIKGILMKPFVREEIAAALRNALDSTT